MPPMWVMKAALLRTFRSILPNYSSPLTKKQIRDQGPFLVKTESKKTLYEEFATKYRKPTEDLLLVTNFVKLMFGLVLSYTAFEARVAIDGSNVSTKATNKTIGDLVEELPNIHAKMDESTLELKKLNKGVLNIHKKMIKNREMEVLKKKKRKNDDRPVYLKFDGSNVYINKELIDSLFQPCN